MVNGISDLLQNIQSGVANIGLDDTDGVNTGNINLAQSLLQQSQQTRNPIVAALTGFVGASALGNLGRREGELAEQERQRKAGLEERRFGLQERGLDIREQQAADQRAFQQQRLGILSAESAKRIEKLQTDIDKAVSDVVGALDPKDEIKIEKDLRGEFTKLSSDFIKQRDAFGRIQASAQDPSAAGDLALIFNYMKLLDPGSTVREGEFANAQNAASIPERIRASYNNAIGGERLTDVTRSDFVDRSQRLFNQASTQQNAIIDQFSNLATRANVNPEDVVIDLGLAIAPEAGKETVLEFDKSFTGQIPSGALELLKNNFDDSRILEQFKQKYNVDPKKVFIER